MKIENAGRRIAGDYLKKSVKRKGRKVCRKGRKVLYRRQHYDRPCRSTRRHGMTHLYGNLRMIANPANRVKINYSLFTVRYSLSIIHYQLFTIYRICCSPCIYLFCFCAA
jgi:hypothetical protein